MALPIFAILAGIGAGVSAYGQIQAGKAQKEALKEQAKQEELAAESQELARRQELNRALAANVAALSTAGISGEGTPASLALESAKQAGLSEMTIDLSERLRRATLMRQARAASSIGAITGAGALIGGLGQAGALLDTSVSLGNTSGGGSGGGESGGSSGGSSGGGD